MELTKRQVRALVLAGNLNAADFPGVFNSERAEAIQVRLFKDEEGDGKTKLLIIHAGQAVAKVDPETWAVELEEPLGYEAYLDSGWIRVYKYIDEER